MGEERRKSARIKKDITVRYSYNINNGQKKWDMTMIRNISEAGMCVTTRQRLSADDILTFLIKIPSRPLEWTEFTGRVVESKGLSGVSEESITESYITRIEFINLEEGRKELLREYIKWFLSKEGGGQK